MKIHRFFAATMILTVMASITALADQMGAGGDYWQTWNQGDNGTNNIGDIEAMNTAAIAAYRSAIENNTWNSEGLKADEFALIDMDNDGILEASVKAYILPNENGGLSCCNYLLYYHEGSLKSVDINIEYYYAYEHGIEYIDSVDLDRKYIGTGRVRGKAIDTVYSFDKNSGLNGVGSWFGAYITYDPNDEKSNYNLEQYVLYGQNLYYINYVEATTDNINYYLNGSGISTGFGEQKKLYE